MNKLSIITINYNDAAGLERTIRSVASQTFRDFQYIVIDGGSTDSSTEVIERFRDLISYSVSEKDKGIYNAQNKGIDQATGEYCLFLNSGDFLYRSDGLEQVFSKDPSADIIYADMMIDSGSGTLSYGSHPDKITFESMIEGTLWHPVSFIRRSLFEKHGRYDESFRIIADYEFFLKTILVEGVSTQHIKVPLTVFNTQGIGSSPVHAELHKRERRIAQERYFSAAVIDSAERHIALKKKRSVEFSEWLHRNPTMLGMANIAWKFLKWTKGVFR
jgi:glycosyltransferase involved in cell wall biosynthesis